MRIKNINSILNKSLTISDKLYKKQIIINSKLPACVNCFYFKPFYGFLRKLRAPASPLTGFVEIPKARRDVGIQALQGSAKSENLIDQKSLCFKYGEKNIVTGTIEYDFAYNIRKNESKCGMNAKKFEEK
jgi:hypothetical protein